MTAAEAAAVWRDVEEFGRRHDLREAHVLRNKAQLKMPSLTRIVAEERILDVGEGVLGPDPLAAAEMDPEVCAFVDAPFGGSTPVSPRSARPAHDLYRTQPAA